MDTNEEKTSGIIDAEPERTDKLILYIPVYNGEGIEETLDRIGNPESLPGREIDWKKYAYLLCEFIDKHSNIIDKDGNPRWRK